ncbi:hypothetical protein AX774_g1638 [Zancudomyces culisetae]|uniref:Uncharacterized protein n=1 Tax=Zancudomyces culisetae TaxID=1213189 RepID=A0A1R1PV53_ZANCU|nr:hypothetical protein AX774_g1638 [Zancudomyces culisetae]|eukprot:OMH84831.1 hypothetical protein AX774_g1638 [Zancudomyces culisetae]
MGMNKNSTNLRLDNQKKTIQPIVTPGYPKVACYNPRLHPPLPPFHPREEYPIFLTLNYLAPEEASI